MCFLVPLVHPAGMFCSYPGSSQPTGLCLAGFYCPAGSTSPNATAYQVLFSFFSCLCYFFTLHYGSLGINHKKCDVSSIQIVENTFTRTFYNLMSWLTENIHLLLSCLGARHPYFFLFFTLRDYALLINGFTLSPTIRRDFRTTYPRHITI